MAHISTTARKFRKQTRTFISKRMKELTGRENKWTLLNPVTNQNVELDSLGMEGLLYSIVPAAREAEYKYGEGVARLMLTYDQMNNGYKDASDLNDIIKIITAAHIHEWDSNLRDMTVRELVDFFHNETKHLDDATKDELAALSFEVNNDYEIKFIPDFETAKTYSEYTTWCITTSESMWKSYTNDGMNNVYFILHKNFKTTPKTDISAKDEYGLSMLSVIVRPYGTMCFCTGRYNHALAGNDSLLTTKELSALIGRNYYEVCLPKTGVEIEEIIFKNWDVVESDSVALHKGWKKILKKPTDHLLNTGKVYTYYDPEKRYLVFDKVYEFDSNDLAIVELNKKYNLINRRGDLML